MSSFRYYRKTGERDETLLRDTLVLTSSRQLGWEGAVAESGRSRAWEPTELTTAGHYLAINLAPQPLPIEVRDGGESRRVILPPDSFQISPANVPFTMRILEPSHYGALEISRPKIRRLLGRDLELPPGLGVIDEPLARIVRELLAEVGRGGSSGPLYSEGLLIAVASRVAFALGRGGAGLPAASAFSTKRLAVVIEAIEDRIHLRLTVEELAAVAGLSPAHFAREFKRATHETPHAFILRRRLERARQLLVDGCSIAQVADQCGFADQPHLSRAFKERFGVPPRVFVRSFRR